MAKRRKGQSSVHKMTASNGHSKKKPAVQVLKKRQKKVGSYKQAKPDVGKITRRANGQPNKSGLVSDKSQLKEEKCVPSEMKILTQNGNLNGAKKPEKRVYSFRKRIVKMKEKPEMFNEAWGVDEESDKLYRFGKRRSKRGRRRSSNDSFDEWGKEKRYPWERKKKWKVRRRITKRVRAEQVCESETDPEERQRIGQGEPCRYDVVLLKKLPTAACELREMKALLQLKISSQKKFFYYEQEQLMKKMRSKVGELSIPIYADVQKFNFKKLKATQLRLSGRLFDAIMMDPPWQLSTSQPSRGVAIGYSSLQDDIIARLPIPELQTEGFLFIWVINAKYALACKMFENWGYNFVDEIVWVKRTVTGKIAKGHGYYLQHSKETCLVGFKGNLQNYLRRFPQVAQGKGSSKEGFKLSVAKDVIFSQRRGQSQKPNEIYQIIEKMVPQGTYLEVFGRRNNLRPKWVTIGNEL